MPLGRTLEEAIASDMKAYEEATPFTVVGWQEIGTRDGRAVSVVLIRHAAPPGHGEAVARGAAGGTRGAPAGR